jgi:hypothetical protein
VTSKRPSGLKATSRIGGAGRVGRSHQLAVGTESRLRHDRRITFLKNRSRFLHLPDRQRRPGRERSLAIRAESNVEEHSCFRVQFRRHRFAGDNVTDLNLNIVRSLACDHRDQVRPRDECNAHDFAVARRKYPERIPRGNFPKLNSPIVRCRCQMSAIGTECSRPNIAAVDKSRHLFSVGNVP